MTPTQYRFIAVETSISMIINAVFSALFMELIFGRATQINLWGPQGLAVDFIPQTFMISAMSVIVPTLVTRRRLRRGTIDALSRPRLPKALQPLWRRVISVGLVLVVLGGGLATVSLLVQPSRAWAFRDLFFYKVAYGALVALVATPTGLVMALSESPTPLEKTHR